MYKINNNILPSYFLNVFTTNLNIHDHFTRQASKFHITSHHTNVRAHSNQIYGTKLWISLSKDITDSASLSVFKTRCIEFMHKVFILLQSLFFYLCLLFCSLYSLGFFSFCIIFLLHIPTIYIYI